MEHVKAQMVGFIRPIRRERRNLTIKTEAYVTTLLIDSKTKRVLGIEYASKTKTNETKLNLVLARKEVILSAGAINSPKILMLSGIGLREELNKHGINVISDLSVGRNLQDHVSMRGLIIALNFTSTRKNNSMKEEDIFYYEETHRGPLSALGTTSCSVFLQTPFEHENSVPDVQLLFIGLNQEDMLTEPELADDI